MKNTSSREIKVLHLESTDVCQAACPACTRVVDPTFDASQKNHLTINQIVKHRINIDDLDKMFMCGVYGDPAAGKHTLDIYRYFRSINPEIVLGMNTNGAIQNTSWWQTLGEIFHRERDYVVFSIDGLEDTNHIYRQGVDWKKLMDNVRAFLSTGAKAHWDMLVFRHNEHQVDDCEQLARDLGFSWFRVKVSKRPMNGNIQTPINWQTPKIQSTDIDCHALRERSAYIDARGILWPCCWIGGTTSKQTIDINDLKQTWNSSKPNPICARTCGHKNQNSNFTSQLQREIELDV